jgi:hypothetical protein
VMKKTLDTGIVEEDRKDLNPASNKIFGRP